MQNSGWAGSKHTTDDEPARDEDPVVSEGVEADGQRYQGKGKDQMLLHQEHTSEAWEDGEPSACPYPLWVRWQKSSDRTFSQMAQGKEIRIEQNRANGV